MDPWITATDAARLYGVTKGTIRRWAREDGWQRRGNRTVQYRWEHAQASYEKRHANRIRQHVARGLTK